jgi:hypothetical protein
LARKLLHGSTGGDGSSNPYQRSEITVLTLPSVDLAGAIEKMANIQVSKVEVEKTLHFFLSVTATREEEHTERITAGPIVGACKGAGGCASRDRNDKIILSRKPYVVSLSDQCIQAQCCTAR